MSRREPPARSVLGAALLALGVAGAPARSPRRSPRTRPARSPRHCEASGRPGWCGAASPSRRSHPSAPGRRSAGSRSRSIPATPTLVTELERIRQQRTGLRRPVRVRGGARPDGARGPPRPRSIGRARRLPTEGEAPAAAPPPRPPRQPACAGSPPKPPGSSRPRRRGGRGPGGDAVRAAARRRNPQAPPHPWRQKTDPAGLFAFEGVPSGDWLVVAIRVSPYAAERLRCASRSLARPAAARVPPAGGEPRQGGRALGDPRPGRARRSGWASSSTDRGALARGPAALGIMSGAERGRSELFRCSDALVTRAGPMFCG